MFGSVTHPVYPVICRKQAEFVGFWATGPHDIGKQTRVLPDEVVANRLPILQKTAPDIALGRYYVPDTGSILVVTASNQ